MNRKIKVMLLVGILFSLLGIFRLMTTMSLGAYFKQYLFGAINHPLWYGATFFPILSIYFISIIEWVSLIIAIFLLILKKITAKRILSKTLFVLSIIMGLCVFTHLQGYSFPTLIMGYFFAPLEAIFYGTASGLYLFSKNANIQPKTKSQRISDLEQEIEKLKRG